MKKLAIIYILLFGSTCGYLVIDYFTESKRECLKRLFLEQSDNINKYYNLSLKSLGNNQKEMVELYQDSLEMSYYMEGVILKELSN